MKISKVKLSAARCALDLGDGSERGAYVDQDYILNKLGRPHRGISLMYCYYPLDKTWPIRASECNTDPNVNFAWGYAYDDYFTYKGGLEGNTEGEPFTYMREVRRHGQDVVLTLTCDPHVSDEQIKAIAKDLSTFGPMYLRLNHEATGNWFNFNKRASYAEVGAFFAHFADIIHKEAPNVKMILCIDGVANVDSEKIEMEDEFLDAIKAADCWSTDKYISLNWGWPFEVAEKENSQHKLEDIGQIYAKTKRSYERFSELCGGVKRPMLISEMNADGDVTGPYRQAELVKEFCELVKNDPDDWFSGFTMYQFRDDGRLGLEFTDPSNKNNGIEWPIMDTYREILNDDFFKPVMTVSDVAESLPVTLRWGDAEDAEGISIELDFEKDPIFAEANFPGELKDANLMLELNGRWFYKAPGAEFVDFMPAFYKKRLTGPCKLHLNIFAPPASGENDPSQGEDWQYNYYCKLNRLPDIRLRFEPVM